MYPILTAYFSGTLQECYEQEKQRLIDADSKLSPVRAGELAAATLAVMAGKEQIELDKDVRYTDIMHIPTLHIGLYNWLVDQPNIKAVLIDLSGTRTLLSDMGDYHENLV